MRPPDPLILSSLSFHAIHRSPCPCSLARSYFLNLVHTRHDASVRRGAIVKALAVTSRHPCINSFRAPLAAALEYYYDHPGREALEAFFRALNATDVTGLQAFPPLREQRLMRRGVSGPTMGRPVPEQRPEAWHWDGAVTYNATAIPLRIPLSLSTDEVLATEEQALTRLVSTFGEASMRIYNAVLTGQRVLFVGYNHAAGDVCEFVLAAASMVSPPVGGVLRRAYPYANLTDLTFLETPGYVAGVTNPVFQGNASWWDLACILNLPEGTGACMSPEEKMKEDEKHNKRPAPQSHAGSEEVEENRQESRADSAFIQKVMSGIRAELGESWVRRMFHDHTAAIMHQCLDVEDGFAPEDMTESAQKGHAANSSRIAAFPASCNGPSLERDPWQVQTFHITSALPSSSRHGMMSSSFVVACSPARWHSAVRGLRGR